MQLVKEKRKGLLDVVGKSDTTKSTCITPVMTHLACNKCGLDNIHAGHILQVTSCFQPESCTHLHKHPNSMIRVQTQASKTRMQGAGLLFGKQHEHMLCLYYNSTRPVGCYTCMQLICLSEGSQRLITCNRGSSLAQRNSAGLLPSYAVSTYLLYLHTSRCGDGTPFPLSLVVIHHSHSLLWW